MKPFTTLAVAGALALTSIVSAQRLPAPPAPPAPPPPPLTPCASVTSVQVVCGQQAPEDLVVLPGAEWVIAGA
ncbi:MAG TPA: hypothetical protein VIY56_03970, partial [Vicinamibacterales bacterium]